MEQINHANGEASAMLAVAQAKAQGLNIVSESLKLQEGKNAASLFIAEEYVHAFNKLARTNNTLILPSNVGDVTSLVSQAMSIYNTVSRHNALNESPTGSGGASGSGPALALSSLLGAAAAEDSNRATASLPVGIGAATEGVHSESVRRKDATLLASEHNTSSKFDKIA